MSLHTWDWEDEDTASMGLTSSLGSFCQSISECDVEEYLKARDQAPESDSDRQYSSIASSDGPASTFNSDTPQAVPCTFIISLAFPGNTGHKGKYINLMEKHRKYPKMDKPITKGHNFYHIEYFPLPDDKEPKKVDVVVFPTTVKVFLDSGVKTVKPWHEGDKVWVSWTQAFNMHVTKELLKKMIFYKITLKIWDTTDKISKKVKYYRLKAEGHAEEAGSPVKWKESGRDKKDLRRRKKYHTEEDIDGKPGDQWKRCKVFSMQLGLKPLLAGWQTISSHGSEKSASILDCLLTLKTEVPIMTEEQKQDLNPLIIKIKSASCLPSQPVPFHELEVRRARPTDVRPPFHSQFPIVCHLLSPHCPYTRFKSSPFHRLGSQSKI
ncbi:hypothetical protein HJG60_007225 [Phyllostomus discolor]|uniref:DUF4550 domain-containing protein n=1 Tax=Phyllostomus discolor TaxID=89673 RepID=A0A833ZL51_9CHIR|nr:hypothetical protein HJG60_007225 [Phyllostomus discolor]